ncbi:MAG: metallophosphatase family protein [Defluviitaleaceae bacterium]|nr:metallophosphatase family protein [Defluviitaleaceae bacterium]
MKIAVMSDIHGNLPALEAVLDVIRKRNIDKLICLGDIIGKGPSSNEVIDICRKECDIVVKGNWDDAIVRASRKEDVSFPLGERTRWYINSITPERMEYLGSLPHSTEFYLCGKLVRLFHAHPANYNRYFSHSSIEQRRELFDYSDFSQEKKTADIAIYADIHSAYFQTVEGKHLINVGSVGNPLDTTQASFIILEGYEGEASFGVQFMRTAYDVERGIEMAKEANVPDLDGYISELRTANYFRRG